MNYCAYCLFRLTLITNPISITIELVSISAKRKIYLPSVYAVACEPYIDVDASEPQTLVQAKERLSNHLLAQDQAPF